MVVEFITFLQENLGAIVAIGGVFGIGLEIAPVKLCPISFVLKKIGHIMNAELIRKVDKIESEFEDFKKENDKEKINSIRKEIVSFSLACQRDEHHTRDEFDRVFDRIDEYHALLKKHGLKNGKIDIEVNYINKVYQICLESHKFFEG